MGIAVPAGIDWVFGWIPYLYPQADEEALNDMADAFGQCAAVANQVAGDVNALGADFNSILEGEAGEAIGQYLMSLAHGGNGEVGLEVLEDGLRRCGYLCGETATATVGAKVVAIATLISAAVQIAAELASIVGSEAAPVTAAAATASLEVTIQILVREIASAIAKNLVREFAKELLEEVVLAAAKGGVRQFGERQIGFRTQYSQSDYWRNLGKDVIGAVPGVVAGNVSGGVRKGSYGAVGHGDVATGKHWGGDIRSDQAGNATKPVTKRIGDALFGSGDDSEVKNRFNPQKVPHLSSDSVESGILGGLGLKPPPTPSQQHYSPSGTDGRGRWGDSGSSGNGSQLGGGTVPGGGGGGGGSWGDNGGTGLNGGRVPGGGGGSWGDEGGTGVDRGVVPGTGGGGGSWGATTPSSSTDATAAVGAVASASTSVTETTDLATQSGGTQGTVSTSIGETATGDESEQQLSHVDNVWGTTQRVTLNLDTTT